MLSCEKACSSMNTDSVTALAVPFLSPVLGEMCVMKKDIKKTG